MNLNDMVLFAKVAELEGISAAARALDIPKSKVSRRIAALEADLDVRLIERTTRAVQLTEVGTLFYQHCKRIVEEADLAVNSVNTLMETPRGLLRVSMSAAVGQYLIAPHLGQFRKHYPEIELQIDLNNRRVDLIAEGYDLVVRVGAMQDSSLMSKSFGNARAHLCASPDYAVLHGLPKTPDELPNHKILIMSNSNNIGEWFLENTSGEIKSVGVEACSSINDFTALSTLVEGGAGIAIIPEYVTCGAIEAGRLVRVLPEWQSTLINYYIVYPSRKGLTKKAEVWIDFFQKKLKAQSPD